MKFLKFLENLLVSDSNEKIRGKSGQIIIQKYLDKSEKIIKWVLNNDRSIKCLLEIYNSLSNIKNGISGSLLKLMEISIGKSFIANYNLVPHDAIIMGLFQLSNNHVSIFGDSDGGGSGEFHLYFKSEGGYIRELHCLNIVPNFRLIRHFSNLKILKIIDYESGRINFRGLGDLINLEQLELNYIEFKSIEDLKGLKGLKNLKELQLINTRIPEIKYLDTLTRLEKIVISAHNNPDWNGLITVIQGLTTLENLKYLDLSGNRIKEIKGLDSLINLERLDLCDNMITEIKGLNSLISLKELYLSYNQIVEIKGLDKLNQLEVLGLSDNKIVEVKNLDNLINLIGLSLNKNPFNIEEVYSQYKKGLFNNYLFKKYLITVIVSQGKDELRRKALTYLLELEPTERYICGYLRNLTTFHKESEAIKILIVEILIHNYLSDSVETLKYFLKYSNSQDFIAKVCYLLRPIRNKESKSLIEFITDHHHIK